LGHSSIRTTALYWKNIYQEPDNEVGPIFIGKNWLERKPPKPITENFPQVPKNSKPIFTVNQPVISNKKPIHQDNSLSTPKTLKKTPGMLTNEILPSSRGKISLENTNKKTNQLKIVQPLALSPSSEQNPTKKEQILLQKIKHLESQLQSSQSKLAEALHSKGELKEKLTEIQAESQRLAELLNKSEAQNNNLKQLLQQQKQRADQAEQQLKIIVRTLKQ